MKFNFFLIPFILLLISCNEQNKKNSLVVFRDYCGGCVSKNFRAINNNKLNDELSIYFDTTDSFVLNEAKRNKLDFIHISNKDIPAKFGDFANIVVLNAKGEVTELTTNDVIEKGKHF
jgi:hypothetical protein